MKRPARPSLLLLPLLLGLLSGTALADEAADARSRAHNESGKRLFAVGMFHEAAEQYKKAYQESPKPAFLYNLAQCYKRLPGTENAARARFYFRGFLRDAPESPLRPYVVAELARLDRTLAEVRKPPRAEDEPGPRQEPAPPIYKRWWFWTLIGVAVTGAAIGTGVALGTERTVDGNVASLRLPLGGARR